MFRFAAPIILIGLAITGFFLFAIPYYDEIQLSKADVASYNEALDNSKTLESERDKLTAKFNTIDPVNLTKLQKLLPDSVDNIRLILEIEKIAKPYGMVLKDVRYDTVSQNAAAPAGGVIQGGVANAAASDYGTWNLEFSTQGTYSNFINFLKDIESNLRIVDVASIQFSSDTSGGPSSVSLSSSSSDSYKYGFKIKTYWLKN